MTTLDQTKCGKEFCSGPMCEATMETCNGHTRPNPTTCPTCGKEKCETLRAGKTYAESDVCFGHQDEGKKLREHAGKWHYVDCAFPDVDQAVCNCLDGLKPQPPKVCERCGGTGELPSDMSRVGSQPFVVCPSCQPTDGVALYSITHHEAGLHGICDESMPCHQPTEKEEGWRENLYNIFIASKNKKGRLGILESFIRQVESQAFERGKIDGEIKRGEECLEQMKSHTIHLERKERRKIFQEGRLEGLRMAKEAVKTRKDNGCLCVHEHGKDCGIWCRNMDAAITAITNLISKEEGK